jgi:hypothetical protein
LRTYCLCGERTGCGISGSTRCQNSSITTHDGIRLRDKAPFRHRAQCGSEEKFTLFTDIFLGVAFCTSAVVTHSRCAQTPSLRQC